MSESLNIHNSTPGASPARYSKAAHLSEFYPYLNGQFQQQQQTHQKDETEGRSNMTTPNGSPRHRRKPSSGTLDSYQSFAASTLDFRHLITKAEITETTEAFNEIVQSAEAYRQALFQVADAAAQLGASLENGARCKGSGAAGEGLLNASGLFFLVANHEQILAHSVQKGFEEPVKSRVNQFRLQNVKNEEQFKIDIKDKVKDLKRREYENSRLAKSKTRNLVTYRSKLMELTSQIDDIDKLKHDYYQTSFDLVQDTSNHILTQLGTIIRAQVEIYEGIARKGWSGGGLDDLIARCPDPFAQDDDDESTNYEVEEGFQINTASKEDTQNLNDSMVTTTSNGISINRETLIAQPTIINQPITTTHTESMFSSTPISKSTLIDQLQQQSDGLKSKSNQSTNEMDIEEEDLNKTIEHEENDNGEEHNKTLEQDDIKERLANLTVEEDDNSFSLPLPGSSRSSKSPRKSDHDDRTSGIEVERTLLGEEHNFWREEN